MKNFKKVFSLSSLLGLIYTGSLSALVKLAGNDRFPIVEAYISAILLILSLAFVGRSSFIVYDHLRKNLKAKEMLLNSVITTLISLGLSSIVFTYFRSVLAVPIFMMAGVFPVLLILMFFDKVYKMIGRLVHR